jgi:predicted Rossmann-fold nucleotide-binding protein
MNNKSLKTVPTSEFNKNLMEVRSQLITFYQIISLVVEIQINETKTEKSPKLMLPIPEVFDQFYDVDNISHSQDREVFHFFSSLSCLIIDIINKGYGNNLNESTSSEKKHQLENYGINLSLDFDTFSHKNLPLNEYTESEQYEFFNESYFGKSLEEEELKTIKQIQDDKKSDKYVFAFMSSASIPLSDDYYASLENLIKKFPNITGLNGGLGKPGEKYSGNAMENILNLFKKHQRKPVVVTTAHFQKNNYEVAFLKEEQKKEVHLLVAKDMTSRISHMYTLSDVITQFNGGFGSIQELLLFTIFNINNMIKNRQPVPILLVNENNHWSSLETVLEIILRNRLLQSDLGLHIVQSSEEYENKVKEIILK